MMNSTGILTEDLECNSMDSSTDYQLTLRLLNMLKKTNYELVQENGQRRLTAPELVRGECERKKGAEIFLGRLPRDCYEDELMPILQSVGRLMELRLMLDFSGSTRGYAFALYEDSKTARRACLELDRFEIRSGHRIGVVKSVDNCRLFFGGVPKDKTKQEFLNELNKMLEGITDIYLYPSAHDKNLNRGFLFVEFMDHRAAAMARRKLIPGKISLWNHEIAVDWADPEPGDPMDDEVMESVTALFVRNLSLDLGQQKVKDVFQKVTKVPILKLKKINHFAFIHYETRQAAQLAMNIMSQPGGVAESEGWEIRWAKPIGATKLLERQRCINEAIAKTNGTKVSESVGQKSNPKKRNSKHSVELLENNNKEVSSMAYMKTLEALVKQKFGGTCFFECICDIESGGYLCKIIVSKDQQTIFEYHSEFMLSKHQAIANACAKMYQHLTWPLNPGLTTAAQCHSKEKIKLNPAVGSPIYWRE